MQDTTTTTVWHYQSATPAVYSGRCDPNIVSPLTGEPLLFELDVLTAPGGERYEIDDGILKLFVEEDATEADSVSRNAVTRTVQDFYEDAPFPNYNEFDTLSGFLKRAEEGVFANLLSRQLPINAKVLEVGCGTGQLSNYLAATCVAHVYATDATLASLRLGQNFAAKNEIPGITFLQMNLFRPCFPAESMDVVISNGVLHHTADTRRAFKSVARLVKPGGYVVIGLYDWIGRVRTDLIRALFKVVGKPALVLDPYLWRGMSADKRRAWIRDQYMHPQERKHSMSEVLQWFEEAGFEFVSSIPKIIGEFSADEKLFEPTSAGNTFDRLAAEIAMIFSLGGDGGLFIMIGRRRDFG